MRNTCLALLVALSASPSALAQPAATIERVTFDEAVRRALANNPTLGQAAQAIVRAEGLLQQSRAAIRPALTLNATNILNNASVGFGEFIASPRNQSTFFATASLPVLAASQWAAVTQARDQVDVARLGASDVRQQIAVSTGQAYLEVVAWQHQVQVNEQARESAAAHLDYAQRRLAAGAGTRLNELRAAQEVSTDTARVEATRLALRRAQEALGVLMVAGAPIDAAAEPVFDVPAVPGSATTPPAAPSGTQTVDDAAWLGMRTDIRLFTADVHAAERVLSDSSKDYYPTATASFVPQAITPAGAFTPSRTWRLLVSASFPVFDGGDRRALKQLRQAALETSKLSLTAAELQARSEVRVADEAVKSTERALVSIRLSAEQAEEVVRITNIAFEAGATTNLEVIDAQRSARDAETAVAIAEDANRRARLDLLTALGQFPRP